VSFLRSDFCTNKEPPWDIARMRNSLSSGQDQTPWGEGFHQHKIHIVRMKSARISIVRVGCHFCVFPSPVSTHAAPPHARRVNAHHEFTFKSHVLVTEQITAGLTRDGVGL
jgi:hypothetical protein